MGYNNTLSQYIEKLPKLDLHCHIDGSFPVDFVKRTLSSDLSHKELLQKLRAPESCTSLTEYLMCFDLPIACMQTPSDITAGILDILKSASEENIKYIELRFAPTCSVNDAQNYTDIYEAAITAKNKGLTAYGINCNIILCAMRHHSLEDNLKMLHTGREYLGYGICAIDLAGDENMHGNAEFIPLFEEANRIGMPFTIHSGECGSSENVRIALEVGAKRVGHGIALAKDPQLMEQCKKARLGLELCPTSNFQTKAVTSDSEYPLSYFLKNGLLATVNTDNRTVSDTTMTQEYQLVCEKYGITEEDLLTLYRNSVEISFADDNLKHRLMVLGHAINLRTQ